MRLRLLACVFALSMGFVLTQSAEAQDAESTLIAVGEMAPDFSLPGATRYGVLQDPVRLSDLRGEVVVLAFFFRARTRG
jgi:peroxiredoxin Q/BCP